jgi:hypothetical protein
VELEQVQVDSGGEHDDGVAFFTFMREIIAPIGRLFAELPPDHQREVEHEVAGAVEIYRRGAYVRVPEVTWIANAHA